MTVTKITEISKSRVQIITDEEFAFVLYKGELRIYQLQEGKEISSEIYLEITERLLPKRAKLRAMNLLKSRPYTTKQLTDKLIIGGYPKEIAEMAISYVASYGYLNDRQYTLDYIECYKESKSKKQITGLLLQKGIDKQLIAECWEENMVEDGRNLEKEQIISWMKKKKFDAPNSTFEEKQKFCAFLYRKGFQIDSIRSVLSLDITSI